MTSEVSESFDGTVKQEDFFFYITGSGEIVKPLINSTQLAVTYRAMPKLLEKRP